MRKMLKKVLEIITSAINQLPDKNEKGIKPRTQYGYPEEKPEGPPLKIGKPEKRKGPIHSEERTFDHPREN